MKPFEETSFTHRTIKQGLWIIIPICLIMSVIGCKKHADQPANVTPNLTLVADNLVSPLSVVEPPDDTKRLFIVDQNGKVWIVPPNGTMLSTPFLDLTGKMVNLSANYDERGLLSLAFHPNFKTNGKFYVFYTAPPRAGGPQPGANWNNLTRISEFKVSSSNANIADLNTERVILEADHPQSNHNGGTVAFGPDGYLYVSIGDGGNKDDIGPGHLEDWYNTNAGGNAQNLWANLMGKILRIDVNSGASYSIPSDNPFATSSNFKKEIYAYGFRNPYRFSFDMGGDHGLYVGDAGQSLYEEINLVTKGGNYGWNIKEGTFCFNTDNDLLIRPTCPSVDSLRKSLVDPIIQLKNKANPDGAGIATVIVGGNVYRGTTLPQLRGRYVFGIFSQGGSGAAGANAKLYVASSSTSGSWSYEDLTPKDYQTNLGYYLKGFGQDLSGELYITVTGVQGVSGTTGKVFELVAAQ
ncbi:MAG: PQQ-dependent sugar dehydrogenase [Flavisolibacter sp.]|nr:PQQ-dependent sugar dehydrogenase [Flavisolibacter sp.]